jgi:hypothetical protein
MFFNMGGMGGGIPFGAGGGGGGGGGRGGARGSPRGGDADTTKFYELLGVSKEADATEIKKAFRKAALQHHPDRGGDPEKFKELSKVRARLRLVSARAVRAVSTARFPVR